MNSHGASCLSGEGTTHSPSIRANLGFSILLKDTLACGLQVAEVKPVTFETPGHHQDVQHGGGRVKVCVHTHLYQYLRAWLA